MKQSKIIILPPQGCPVGTRPDLYMLWSLPSLHSLFCILFHFQDFSICNTLHMVYKYKVFHCGCGHRSSHHYVILWLDARVALYYLEAPNIIQTRFWDCGTKITWTYVYFLHVISLIHPSSHSFSSSRSFLVVVHKMAIHTNELLTVAPQPVHNSVTTLNQRTVSFFFFSNVYFIKLNFRNKVIFRSVSGWLLSSWPSPLPYTWIAE